MKKPDMSKAPKWAKLWLWSPEFCNQSGYWAGLPDEMGKDKVQVVGGVTRPTYSDARFGLWKRAHEKGGMVIKVNFQLENK